MLALIAGEGRLPVILAGRLRDAGRAFVLCEMAGQPSTVAGEITRMTFRLETLGTLLARLRSLAVTEICLAGAVHRPRFEPTHADAPTRSLLPAIRTALEGGDDTAIRAIAAMLSAQGFAVVPAHELAPDLMPPAGVPTRAAPGPDHLRLAAAGPAAIAELGAADAGQACVIAGGEVVATEGPDGTAAMLARTRAPGGILFKAPKPDQSMLADVPAIGPETAAAAARAGLAGIVVEAGGVLVLDGPETIAACDREGLFLWVREPG